MSGRDKFDKALSLMDRLAGDMKIFLNDPKETEKKYNDLRVAETSIKYNFLCEIIWKLEEMDDNTEELDIYF